MKWKIVIPVLLFSFSGLFTGCYTQLSSGYDDYYNSSPKPYKEKREVRREYVDDSQETQSTEAETTETQSEAYDDDNGNVIENNYYYGSSYFPHYRRYFHYYHPSYSFSISFCRTEP
ncbi:MAG: hypothetical protein HYV28_13535, partial [Ignavibacteriales bacterium]|nr:hypothetical protein [Ignavibacteriales bacterium]